MVGKLFIFNLSNDRDINMFPCYIACSFTVLMHSNTLQKMYKNERLITLPKQ